MSLSYLFGRKGIQKTMKFQKDIIKKNPPLTFFSTRYGPLKILYVYDTEELMQRSLTGLCI